MSGLTYLDRAAVRRLLPDVPRRVDASTPLHQAGAYLVIRVRAGRTAF